MTDTEKWQVYIVRCSDGTFYTGIAKDLERRLRQHNAGPDGAKYTRARRPVTLVYTEESPSRSEALKTEYRIRKLPAAKKRTLAGASGASLDLNRQGAKDANKGEHE